MAATNGWMKFIGVQTGKQYPVSVYHAGGDAVGTYLHVDQGGIPASTNSLFDFSFPEDVRLVDFLPKAATGLVEIMTYQPTGLVFDYADLTTVNQNRMPIKPLLPANVKHKIIVRQTLAA